MVKLIDRYGIEIVKKGKIVTTLPELKQEMIDKVLHENWFSKEFLLDYALPNRGLLPKLDGTIQEKTGILLLRKQEGEYLKWDVNVRKLGKK